jgi:uncharacterized Zn-finger protein
MRIILPSPFRNQSFRAKCPYCATFFAYEYPDIKTEETDVSKFYEDMEEYEHYVCCPYCNNSVIVELPKLSNGGK